MKCARSFCGVCGSTLFCESTKHPDTIDVVLANMEGGIDRAPEMHVWFSDRVDWVATDDGLPRLKISGVYRDVLARDHLGREMGGEVRRQLHIGVEQQHELRFRCQRSDAFEHDVRAG